MTAEFAKKHKKPWIHIDLKELAIKEATEMLEAWLTRHEIKVLNVAGPRARKDPAIYEATLRLLEETFLNSSQ